MSQEDPIRDVVRDIELEPAAVKPGIMTTEFWTSLGVIASNLVLGLVMFGRLEQADAQTLSDAITAICAGIPLILANVAVLWKYVASRAAVKTAVVQETTKRLELRENLRMQFRTERFRMQLNDSPNKSPG